MYHAARAPAARKEEGTYYMCPECGYQQKSNAKERVRCHRCDRSYLKRKAKKKDEKTPDPEMGTGFVRFRQQ